VTISLAMSKKFIHRRAFCPRGHSMDDAYICRDGRGYEHRRCRTCRTENLGRWRLANRNKILEEGVVYADKRREKTWRFRMWENAHLSSESKDLINNMTLSPHIANVKELNCPVFVVELYGRKHREVLNEPLPSW